MQNVQECHHVCLTEIQIDSYPDLYLSELKWICSGAKFPLIYHLSSWCLPPSQRLLFNQWSHHCTIVDTSATRPCRRHLINGQLTRNTVYSGQIDANRVNLSCHVHLTKVQAQAQLIEECTSTLGRLDSGTLALSAALFKVWISVCDWQLNMLIK